MTSPDASGVGARDAAAELARVRAERDAAVSQLRKRERRAERRATARRVTVAVLVVLFAILLPLTVTITWVHRTVLNTNAYVNTVAPIASEPAVTDAVSRQLTTQIYTSLDPQAVISQSLPPKAAFLAAPIANGAKGYLQQGINKVLQSDQFQTVWVEANRFAHTQLVAVLHGDTKVLQTTNGQVVLNLVPLLNDALKNVQGFASSVVGKPVTLPTISGNELPSAACAKISAALNRPVPPTCGQIALFPADKLQNAQRMVRAFDRGTVALLVITPLLALGTLWLSRRRRRTLLQLTIGGMLGLVVVRRALIYVQNQVIASGPPQNQQARSAIVHQVLNGFFGVTWWFLIGGLVIVALALVTGPYRWAVATRRGVVRGAQAGARLAAAGATGTVSRARSDTTVAFVRRHFDLLRVAGVVVAVLILLIFDVNFWWFLVVAALLAAYEVWLYRLRPPRSITLPPESTPGPPAGSGANPPPARPAQPPVQPPAT